MIALKVIKLVRVQARFRLGWGRSKVIGSKVVWLLKVIGASLCEG